MLAYAIHRASAAGAVVLLALALAFLSFSSIPGDPATILYGERVSEETRAEVTARLGLDQPLPVRFLAYLGQAARGDLGVDLVNQRPVLDLVLKALPHTVALAFAGLGWALIIGVGLGVWTATKAGAWQDKIVGALSVAVICIPSFLVSIYAMLVFAIWLRWLPASGSGADDVTSQLRHLVLPAFALGLAWVGYFARTMRGAMLETLSTPFIRAARARGLSNERIIWGYAFRVAALPVISLVGVSLGALMSGTVFVEMVFQRPGVGLLLYEGAAARNYPLVLGALTISVTLLAACTLIADLATALLDPRVRQKSSS